MINEFVTLPFRDESITYDGGGDIRFASGKYQNPIQEVLNGELGRREIGVQKNGRWKH